MRGRMTTTLRVLGLAALLVGAGCQYHTKPFETMAARAPEDVTDADLYVATVRVLTDLGYELSANDPSAGVVRTRFVSVEEIGDAHLDHAWHAVIESGTVRLSIECQKRAEHEIFACDEGQRHVMWVDFAPQLRERIFDAARRHAASRRAHGADAVPAPVGTTSSATDDVDAD
jgi:hypothetical protein